MRRITGFTCTLAVLLLPGCGGDLSGRYTDGGKDGASFTFKGKTVEIEAIGPIQVGTYKVDDGKVYITIANQTQALKIDDKGCIDGGFLFGTLCKQS